MYNRENKLVRSIKCYIPFMGYNDWFKEYISELYSSCSIDDIKNLPTITNENIDKAKDKYSWAWCDEIECQINTLNDNLLDINFVEIEDDKMIGEMSYDDYLLLREVVLNKHYEILTRYLTSIKELDTIQDYWTSDEWTMEQIKNGIIVAIMAEHPEYKTENDIHFYTQVNVESSYVVDELIEK